MSHSALSCILYIYLHLCNWQMLLSRSSYCTSIQFSVSVFPGDQTHDLCAANAMLLIYRHPLHLLYTLFVIVTKHYAYLYLDFIETLSTHL